MAHVVGIDLGGTSIKAVCVTATGVLLAEARVPFVDRDREWARKIRGLTDAFARTHGPADALGLSAPASQ